MVTAKLEDSGPTTTINFKSFTEHDYSLTAENFVPFAYPENEGAEVIFEQQWFEVYKFHFEIEQDVGYPGSGDSAATKFDALTDFVKDGGDNESLMELTYNVEDSAVSPATKTLTGKVKYVKKHSMGGDHITKIDGELEFWVCDA